MMDPKITKSNMLEVVVAKDAYQPVIQANRINFKELKTK